MSVIRNGKSIPPGFVPEPTPDECAATGHILSQEDYRKLRRKDGSIDTKMLAEKMEHNHRTYRVDPEQLKKIKK